LTTEPLPDLTTQLAVMYIEVCPLRYARTGD
jgi:hypothetical protein